MGKAPAADVDPQRDDFPTNVDKDCNLPPMVQKRPSFALFSLLRKQAFDAVTLPPPDGGLEAWIQVLVGHLVLFCSWGYINTFGFFQAHYVDTLNVTPSQISWIVSVQVFLLSFAGAFSGRLTDAGYFRYTLIGGFTFLSIGIFMTSLAHTYWQVFLAQGVCCGIGSGLLFCPTNAMVATYFLGKRSIALGIVLCGSSTGGLILPLMVQQLLPRAGFNWTVRTIGFLVLFCFAICLALARTRIPPRASGPLIELGAFKEKPYSLFTVGIFCSLWAVYFTYFYIDLYAIDIIGISPPQALTMLYIINGAGIPGRLISAMFADRYLGILNTYLTLGCIAGILLYCWIAVETYGGLVAIVVLYGLVGGGVQGTALSSLPTLTKDLSKLGVRSGMILSIVAFACLTGPPLAGALIEQNGGSYTYAFAWGGTSFIVGSGFVSAARLMLTKSST